MINPLVTIAVPSYNQGAFLEENLKSIFAQHIPVEVFVLDAGSTDNSIDIIKKWQHLLSGWRSHKDNGQSAAINEGIKLGSAPYVCWLNSDDYFLPSGLKKLIKKLETAPTAPAVYARSLTLIDKNSVFYPTWVEPFSKRRLAIRCIVSQPATLIRRSAWEKVNGLNENLHMAMDYDLWWKLSNSQGDLEFLNDFTSVNRDHDQTKTKNKRKLHYQEAIDVVNKHYGSIPLKWWYAQPYAVWFKSFFK